MTTTPSLTFTRQKDAFDNTEYMAETKTHRYLVHRGHDDKNEWQVEIWTLRSVGELDPVFIADKHINTIDYLYKRHEAYREAQKHADETYRRTHKTPARPGVAAVYAHGTAIPDGETFTPGRREGTADLVVTLASDLEKMAQEPGRAARVAAVWAELVSRGVTLT